MKSNLMPDRDTWVDLGSACGLVLLALVGLYDVFGGPGYLLVAALGAVAGALMAHVVVARGLAFPVALGALSLTFLVCGAPAVPDVALAGVLPSPGVPMALLAGLVNGWKSIVTIAPPVGMDSPIGVVPYALAFTAASVAVLLARRTTWALPPAVPVVVVLGVACLLGTHESVSVLLLGSVLGAGVLAWAVVRANRPRRSEDGSVNRPQLVMGTAMLVFVALVALPLASVLPFTGGDRFAVRDEIVPPFDPRNEPSPLGGFRKARLEEGRDVAHLAVSDLPTGARLRVATMDTYDGVVWVVGGPSATGSGRFERVGSKILPTPPGNPVEVTVEVLSERRDVWLPSVGWTRSVRFEGDRAGDLQRDFRYNRLTGTGAVPSHLRAGDRYVLDAQVPTTPEDLPSDLDVDPAVQLPVLPDLQPDIQDLAASWAGGGSGLARARQIEAHLKEEGYYSDGGTASGAGLSPPGHSLARVYRFVDREDGLLVGNAEQYAATMALLARQQGLPARVVLGFDPEVSSTSDERLAGDRLVFTGDDLHAWVEIAFDGVGWVAFDPTPERDKEPVEDPPPSRTQSNPPPQDLPIPENIQLPEELAQVEREPVVPEDPADAGGFAIPAWVGALVRLVAPPVLLVAMIVALIVAAKAMRRRRRRYRGSPVARLHGAWREVCDQARDLGASVPRRSTRHEEALAIAAEHWTGADAVAAQVDALMFSAPDPDPDAIERVWEEIDGRWAAIRRSLGRRERLLARLNVASLRRAR